MSRNRNFGNFLLFFAILINPSSGNLVSLDVGGEGNSSNLEIDLGEFSSHSILLQIYAQSPFPTEERDHFLTILVPEDSKLVGFVNYVHLRVLWISKNATGEESPNFWPECVDYISLPGGGGGGGERICHDVTLGDPRIHPPTLVGPRSFRTSVGEHLELHVHTEPFINRIVHQNPDPPRRRHLAEIAFTAYAECPEEDDQDLEGSGSGLDKALSLSRCSQEEDFSCIPSSLICDSEVHCLFPEALGQDEKGCGPEDDDGENETGSESESGEDVKSFSTLLSNETSTSTSTPRERWNRRHGHGHGRNRNRTLNRGGSGQKRIPVVLKEETEESHTLRNYMLPTAAFFFIIWGVVTLFRKCYRCYRSEYGKEEQFYY